VLGAWFVLTRTHQSAMRDFTFAVENALQNVTEEERRHLFLLTVGAGGVLGLLNMGFRVVSHRRAHLQRANRRAHADATFITAV
jgi:hypothetical protein